MLKGVIINGFKSISPSGVNLELKPLTFLVGQNGSGKSSVLDAIAFASQEGKSSDFFRFSELDDLRFKSSLNEPIIITVETQNGKVFGLTASYDSDIDMSDDDVYEGEFFSKVFPVRAIRGIIKDAEFPTEVTWVLEDGTGTVEILEKLPDAQYRTKRRSIQKWASRFGMLDVAATIINRNQIKGSYADDKLDVPLNLYLSSTGSRQVLPVIVQLFWAEPESIILIEEPEISLHPAAQIDLMEMFAEALKEDKQIIATTHSLFMIQAIGYGVQKGWFTADDVAVHHIEKKKDVGTVAKQLEVKETGYVKNWIPSFARVEEKLMREWVNTLPEE